MHICPVPGTQTGAEDVNTVFHLKQDGTQRSYVRFINEDIHVQTSRQKASFQKKRDIYSRIAPCLTKMCHVSLKTHQFSWVLSFNIWSNFSSLPQPGSPDMPLKATPELFLPSEKAKLCTIEEFEKTELWDSGQPVLAPGFSCASFMFPLLSLPVPLSLPVLTPLGSWVLGSTGVKSRLVLWWPQDTGQKNPQAHMSFQSCSLVSMETTELPRPRKANRTEEQSMPYRKLHYRR